MDGHHSLKDRGRAEGHTSRRWWPAIGAAGVILLAALLFWPSSPKVREPPRRTRPATAAQTKTVEPPAAGSDSSTPKQLVTVHQRPRAAASEASSDDDAHEGYVNPPEPTEEGHPHPHTPEHERIFHENNVIGQLNGAMDVGDFIGMRRLNAEYRKEYPEDGHLLQEGYEIIADCLEELTEERRARAKRFWQTERGSQLRRYVRRHCLSEQ
jgi:hypothetical protein